MIGGFDGGGFNLGIAVAVAFSLGLWIIWRKMTANATSSPSNSRPSPLRRGRSPARRAKPAPRMVLDGPVSPMHRTEEVKELRKAAEGKKDKKMREREQLLRLAGVDGKVDTHKVSSTKKEKRVVSNPAPQPKKGWTAVAKEPRVKKERVASEGGGSDGAAGWIFVTKPRRVKNRGPYLVFDKAKPSCLAEEAIAQAIYHLAPYISIESLGSLLLVSKSLYRVFERASRRSYLALFERDCEPISLCDRKDSTGLWVRQCEWFLNSWPSTKYWYSRLRYESRLQSAVGRGARGFMSADVTSVTVSGVRLDGMKMHRTFLYQQFPQHGWFVFSFYFLKLLSYLNPPTNQPPVDTWKLRVPDLSRHGHDFSSKLMRAMLTLSRPDELFISMDQEHRYDVFFPHVLQLGVPYSSGSRRYPGGRDDITYDNGPRDLISGGETLETAICDNRFGVRTIAWTGPFVVIWGAALIALVREDPPLAFQTCLEPGKSPTTSRSVFGEKFVATDWIIDENCTSSDE